MKVIVVMLLGLAIAIGTIVYNQSTTEYEVCNGN